MPASELHVRPQPCICMLCCPACQHPSLLPTAHTGTLCCPPRSRAAAPVQPPTEACQALTRSARSGARALGRATDLARLGQRAAAQQATWAAAPVARLTPTRRAVQCYPFWASSCACCRWTTPCVPLTTPSPSHPPTHPHTTHAFRKTKPCNPAPCPLFEDRCHCRARAQARRAARARARHRWRYNAAGSHDVAERARLARHAVARLRLVRPRV